jgi:hypothetical protein
MAVVAEHDGLRQRYSRNVVEEPLLIPKPTYTCRTDYFRIWMVFFMCVGTLYIGYRLYSFARPIVEAVVADDVLVVTVHVESPTGDLRNTDLRIPLRSLLKLYLEQSGTTPELVSST